MDDVLTTIAGWAVEGRPPLWIIGGVAVAACFVVFNTVRIALYLPQLRTCLRDMHGCPTINLFTWCSWIIANASTGLYMWMFQGDAWGLVLNMGNAAMCAATVAVALMKRRRHRNAHGPRAGQLSVAFEGNEGEHRQTGAAQPQRALQVGQVDDRGAFDHRGA